MKGSHTVFALAAGLLVAGGWALVAVFGTGPGRGGEPVPPAGRPAPRVAWRAQLNVRADRPCPVADGWVVADAAGGVTKVAVEGRVRWRVAFSNEAFAGAAESAGGCVVVASESGRVLGLDGASGTARWSREAGARFQHAPVAGMRGHEAVVWLVSQEDGRLFCLRTADGSVVWAGEATNRCDGEPAAWEGRVAYGNCDGAVYVFDAADGTLKGSVSVGDDDQMAGGILALASGLLVTGTRQGNLAVINPGTLACVAKVKISEGEAFVTPVAHAPETIAMGSEEGEVTLWRVSGKTLAPAGRFAAGAAVKSLLSTGGRLYALAGGVLCVIDGEGQPVLRLALGDDVGRLAGGGAGELACVADGALVCVKGGGR